MLIGRDPGIDVVMPRKCSIAGPAGLAGLALAAASPAALRTAATDAAPIAAANVLRIAASLVAVYSPGSMFAWCSGAVRP